MDDAGVRPTLDVTAGETGGWLHVLHRRKAGRDVFFVCTQNHQGAARRFTFRVTADGEPDSGDPIRGEIAAPVYRRIDARTVVLAEHPERCHQPDATGGFNDLPRMAIP